MERALRERRERADRLDLVAEELDAQRFAAGGREDVDDAAAHGELAAIVHALDTVVAGERKRLGKRVDTRFEPGPHLDGSRTGVRGRQSLSERPRRRAHEPAALEYVERPRPLADEVRWRRKAGLVGDAATRQQPDRVVAEEP